MLNSIGLKRVNCLFTENELSAEQEMMLSDGFKMDVLGQPRKNPVPLPTVIKGGRPGAIPNTKVINRNIC